MMWQATWPGCNACTASVNTHTALAMDEAASTLHMMMLLVGHTCCIACIAASRCHIWYRCFDITSNVILQAKAMPELEVQETSEPRCHL